MLTKEEALAAAECAEHYPPGNGYQYYYKTSRKFHFPIEYLLQLPKEAVEYG